YHDDLHDIHLARKIHKGLRPSIPKHVPKLVADLINRCWNDQPEERPTSEKICDTISNWNNEIKNNEVTEFVVQIREADKMIKNNMILINSQNI
ncbi:17240_t:CDS:2, partial [Racocetra fulgida]